MISFQPDNTCWRMNKSKNPMNVLKAPDKSTSPINVASCSLKPLEDPSQRTFSPERSASNFVDLAHFSSTDCISDLMADTSAINCAYSVLYSAIFCSISLTNFCCRSSSSWFACCCCSIDFNSFLMGSIWFNNCANFIWLSTHKATGPAHLEARLMAAQSQALLFKYSFSTFCRVESFKLSALYSRMAGMKDASLVTFRTTSQFTEEISGLTMSTTASMAILTPSGGFWSTRSSSKLFLSTPDTAFFAASSAGSTSAISFPILSCFSAITSACSFNFPDNLMLWVFFSSASP
mmetsp:Transcript_125257/g.362395  ORF Transcript_125257/g.362395 Transcript_125257/m.362395 type:complete len:292 (-) Transcript_125257:620-1495(-)